jgi:parallel beta-helix repeat protein
MRSQLPVPAIPFLSGAATMGGAAGQYLTIKNYPGEKPLLGGERRVIVDEAHYLRIEGIYFQLPYRISGGGVGFQVVNNTFMGSQPAFAAIEFFSSNGLIEGNTIEIRGGGNTRDHGIYLHAGHNNVIRNNVISGMSGYGIHVYDATSSGGERAAIGYDRIMIEDNIITSSRLRAGIIISPGDGVRALNITIRGNTIVNNAINGVRIRYDVQNVKIFNNTFAGNGWEANNEDDQSAISVRDRWARNIEIKNNIICLSRKGGYQIQNREGSRGVVVERNLYWGSDSLRLKGAADPAPLWADPLFIDAGANDFVLHSSSPAVDAGINIGLPYFGSAPDLGAFELEQK